MTLSEFLKPSRIHTPITSLRTRNKMQFRLGIKTVLLAIAIFGLSPQLAVGQNAAPPSPPIGIGGFAYQFIPQGRVHMNICESANCVPGSKVSYIFYPPSDEPDFEDFKLTQEKLLPLLEERAPKDSTIIMGQPERSGDQLFTTFSNRRETRTPDGKSLFVKSNYIFMKTITISMISSSNDETATTTNSDLFLLGLVTWSQALANKQSNAQ